MKYNMEKEQDFSYKQSILILITITFLCYLNAIVNEFVWDDWVHIEKFKNQLRDFSDLLKFFQSTNIVGQPFYYRPLMLVSYGLDYLIFRDNPMGYHLTSITLHIINVCLIFFITRRLIDNKIGFFSALLFAVHPVHCEAVSWISARADVLAGLFSLLTMLFYIKFFDKRQIKYLVFTVLFYSFSLFTKEISLMLLIVFIILPYFMGYRLDKSAIFLMVLSFLVTLGYLLIRFVIVTQPLGDYYSLSAKIATVPIVLLSYFKLFFFPFDLKLLYQEPRVLLIPNIYSYMSWCLLIAVIFLIYFIYKKNKVCAFFLIFYFLFILPVSGVITFIRISPVADRYLYLPSFGLSVLCVYCFFRIYEKLKIKKLVSFLGIGVLFLLFILSIFRNFHWDNQYNFLNRMIKDKPDYFGPYIHLGHYFMMGNRYKEAERAFFTALKYIDDTEKFIVFGNLCSVYRLQGNYEDAESYCLMSISQKKDYDKAYYNLAMLYFETGSFVNSYEMILNAIRYSENIPEYYNMAGVIASELGKKEEALFFINKAVELNPEKEEYRRNREMILGR